MTRNEFSYSVSMPPNFPSRVLMPLARSGPAAGMRDIRHLIASSDVSCTIEGKDRYDNDVGVCFVGSIDLGRDLVKHGLAVADKQAPRYLAEEREARILKRNLWSGSFMDPGEYRRGGRP